MERPDIKELQYAMTEPVRLEKMEKVRLPDGREIQLKGESLVYTLMRLKVPDLEEARMLLEKSPESVWLLIQAVRKTKRPQYAEGLESQQNSDLIYSREFS